MLRFYLILILCCIVLEAPTTVESASYKPWLSEEVLFLADVCCLMNEEFIRIRVELFLSAKIFSDISSDRNANGSIYLYAHNNSTRPETPTSNPTFTSINTERCGTAACLQQAAVFIKPENATSASTAKAIEHVSAMFLPWKYNIVQRKTLVVITTSTADSRNALLKSYNLARDRNITVYAVGIGSGVSEAKLSLVANGGMDNARVYLSNEFNCSTCDLVKDLKVNLNTTPSEPDWCTVYTCDPTATCQWRWPYCKCRDGCQGNGTVCTRIYLHEFTQSLSPGLVLTSGQLRDVKSHLTSVFYPPLDLKLNYNGLYIVSSSNGLRYYVQYAGKYETVDVLLQRYAADVKKWFFSSYYKPFRELGLGLPQPVSCEQSYPNHISSFYFPNTLVNSMSSTGNLCPNGFPRASIQCVPHNSTTSQGLLLGAKFDRTTLNTVSCDATLSQIDTTILDLSKLVNTSGQLQLLTAGHKLNESEIQNALNIIAAIKTAVENSSLKVSPHVLGNIVDAISQVITGLKMNPTYKADLKMRHKVIDTLSYLAHSLNITEVGRETWEFQTNNIQLKVEEVPKTDESVAFAPWKPLYNYNLTMYPLNASIYLNKSASLTPDGKVRTVIVFLNSSTMKESDVHKQGMVAASTSKNPMAIFSTPNVSVKMLSAKESYGRVLSDGFQTTYVRQQCVKWDMLNSDWSTENCCLDNDLYPQIVCKCTAGVVSMQTTTTKVAPIIEQSILIVVTCCVFSFLLCTLFVWIIYKRNELDSDPFYHQRILCLTISFTYLLYAFALPCLNSSDINNGYGTYLVPWKFNTGMAQTTLLHFAVLSTWLLLSLYCYGTYKRAVNTQFPGRYAAFVPLIVYVIAACAVVIDAGYFLGYLDKTLANKDFCRPDDWRFITSTYLADNMCWISGKSFYVASFICLLVSVIVCVLALILAIIKAVKLKGNKHHNRPIMKDALFAFLLSALFGVCCTFAQLIVEAVEVGTRETMEICFIVSTGVLMVAIICVWYVLPGLRKIDQGSVRDTVVMDNVQSASLMKS